MIPIFSFGFRAFRGQAGKSLDRIRNQDANTNQMAKSVVKRGKGRQQIVPAIAVTSRRTGTGEQAMDNPDPRGRSGDAGDPGRRS